jgi:hypothetical protein
MLKLSLATSGIVISSYDIDGLSINNLDKSGSTVAMALPKLQTINNTRFSGAIQRHITHFSFPRLASPRHANELTSVPLPSLVNTKGSIYITAFEPLSVNLTTLKTVNMIDLSGNISRYCSLPPHFIPPPTKPPQLRFPCPQKRRLDSYRQRITYRLHT